MNKRSVLGRTDVPYAHSFQTFECGDPGCGVHVISLDADNNPICETVMSPAQVDRFAHYLHSILRNRKDSSHELPSPRPN